MGRKKEIEKWIDLSELPIWESGTNKGKINWSKCTGKSIDFMYDGIKGKIKIIDFDKKGQRLNVKYLDNEVFKTNTNSVIRGNLGIICGKITTDFKVNVGDVLKDNNRDITIIDKKHEIKIYNGQKHNKKYYKFKCKKCGFDCSEHYDSKNKKYKDEHWIEEVNLLSNQNGCPACCPNPQIVVEGINDIPTTAPWMVEYFVNPENAKKYTCGSTKREYFKCPDCGRIKEEMMIINNVYKRHSVNCVCSDGFKYPEKFMYSLLKQLNIEFEMQYSPEWIKPKRYDFYIPNKNIIIEMDGRQHKQPISQNSNWSTSLGEQIKNDNYKDRVAEKHGIKVIRIDCEFSDIGFIKNNILSGELDNVFDLYNINWDKCEEFALSNLCKKTCEIKRDNPEMTTTEIGKIIGLDRNTVLGYLKKGSRVWQWCNYNGEKEKLKNKERVSKPVEIFKDGISLGTFASVMELSRQSEELFGVELKRANIYLVCQGKQDKHKDYTFKYVEGKDNSKQ